MLQRGLPSLDGKLERFVTKKWQKWLPNSSQTDYKWNLNGIPKQCEGAHYPKVKASARTAGVTLKFNNIEPYYICNDILLWMFCELHVTCSKMVRWWKKSSFTCWRHVCNRCDGDTAHDKILQSNSHIFRNTSGAFKLSVIYVKTTDKFSQCTHVLSKCPRLQHQRINKDALRGGPIVAVDCIVVNCCSFGCEVSGHRCCNFEGTWGV